MEENISLQNKDKLDNVLAYVFIKKLIKPINTTEAFKLGLIDNEVKLLKEPETDEEKRTLSLFDRIVFLGKSLKSSFKTKPGKISVLISSRIL